MKFKLRRIRHARRGIKWLRVAGLALAVVLLALTARAGAAALLVRPVRVEEGSAEDVVAGEAYVIRDEECFFAPAGGEFKPLVQDGEKVRVGSPIMQGEESPLVAEIKEQLNLAQRALDQWKQDSSFKLSSARSQMQLAREKANSLMAQVLESMRSGDTARQWQLEGLLQEELAQHASLAAEYDQAMAVGWRLEEEKARIERALQQAVPELRATVPGIVSFKLDGLEAFLGKTPLSKLTPRALRLAVSGSGGGQGQAGFRIVKSLDVVVGVVCSVQEASRIARQRSAVVEIEGKQFSGKLKEFSDQDPPGYVTAFFDLPSAAEQLFYTRRAEAKLILERRWGGVVPRGCVFSRGGTTGVYVVRKSIARFQPVEVLGQVPGGGLLVGNLSPGQYVVSFPWLAREGQVVR
ncbi:MAG: HlyD family efflux transporter periplasmic adaptor subunit [Bacillota bacterium]